MKKLNNFLNLKLFLLFLILFFSLFSLVSAGELKVTEEHPFLVNGSWISAKDLQVGDILQTADGKKVRITSLEDIVSPSNFSVYNLEAGIYHDFVVNGGDNLGVVVHNSDLQMKFNRYSKSYLERIVASSDSQFNSGGQFYASEMADAVQGNVQLMSGSNNRKVILNSLKHRKNVAMETDDFDVESVLDQTEGFISGELKSGTSMSPTASVGKYKRLYEAMDNNFFSGSPGSGSIRSFDSTANRIDFEYAYINRGSGETVIRVYEDSVPIPKSGGQNFKYAVYDVADSAGNRRLMIMHGDSSTKEAVLNHLDNLYNKILVEKDAIKVMDSIAEYEWFFFRSNPTGRAGASLGDTISLSFQYKKGLPLRKTFESKDFEALSRTLDDYKKFVRQEFIRDSAKLPLPR